MHLWGLNEAPKLTVNVGNSATETKFTWSYEGDCGQIVDHVDLKIWKGKLWEGDYYQAAWGEKGTSKEFILPEGHYEAYIDRSTPLSSASDPVKMSNVVTFDVKAATFNVTFNANGGSVSQASKTVTHNSTYGSLPTPTRTGYTFNGWYTGTIGVISQVGADTKVTITDNQTLYANWTANGYTIAYNSNGGSGSTGNSALTYDKTANLNANSFSRTGYTFKGWNTKTDGSGTAYADKASVKNLATSGTVTLYAQWTAKAVSVKFFRNHNGSDESVVTETFTYDVSNQKFGYKTDGTSRYSKMNAANVGFGEWSRTGYEMLGWSTDRNAKSIEHSTYSAVSNNWIDSKSSSVNLYAIWRAKQYTVTFDADGGNISPISKTVIYDSTYGDLPTPTKAGCTFIGWYTASSGGSKVNADTKVEITSNQTLYAKWIYKVWEEENYSITYAYDTDDGCVAGTMSLPYGSKYGELPSPTKTGYTFVGWFSEKTGGIQITSDMNLIVAADHVLYDHWEANTYKVDFNVNGGSISQTSKTVTYNSTYGDLPTPTRAGYTFLGWFTEKTVGTKITSDTKLTIASNHTLYAQWKAVKGDLNNDSTINIADAVMLQKWLLGSGSLTNWKNADLCEDGRIDVFDMVEMRKLLT